MRIVRVAIGLTAVAACGAQEKAGPALRVEFEWALPATRLLRASGTGSTLQPRASFSADGKHLFVWRDREDWVVDLRTGKSRRVALGASRTLSAGPGAIGPEVLVTTTSGVWLVAASSALVSRRVAATPFPDGIDDLRTARSPDGRQVLLHTCYGKPALIELATGATVRLPTFLTGAVWNREGRELWTVTGSTPMCEDPVDEEFVPSLLQVWSARGKLRRSVSYSMDEYLRPASAADSLDRQPGTGDVVLGGLVGVVTLRPTGEVRARRGDLAVLWCRFLRKDRILVHHMIPRGKERDVRLAVFSYPEWQKPAELDGADIWEPQLATDRRRVVFQQGDRIKVARIGL